MLNKEYRISIPKKRSRYQKGDLGHLDTTKKTSRYPKKTHLRKGSRMRENCTNQCKILKIDTFSGGGTQFYAQNDLMDIWAFLISALEGPPPPTKASTKCFTNVSTKVPTRAVGVHLFCFHLFWLLTSEMYRDTQNLRYASLRVALAAMWRTKLLTSSIDNPHPLIKGVHFQINCKTHGRIFHK